MIAAVGVAAGWHDTGEACGICHGDAEGFGEERGEVRVCGGRQRIIGVWTGVELGFQLSEASGSDVLEVDQQSRETGQRDVLGGITGELPTCSRHVHARGVGTGEDEILALSRCLVL